MSSKYRIMEAPPYMPSLFCPTMSYPTVSSYHLVESYPIEPIYPAASLASMRFHSGPPAA